ncbi:MAG: neutral/alkaline non-lysosomal ceramidase N-terminal domain-containing protein [Bryobacterales bacterium]
MLRVLFLAFAIALPALPAWKAGAAKRNITPSEPIWMSGYASRDKPSEGVYAPIYAKALALKDNSGGLSVMVTADLVGFTRSVSDPIFAEAKKRYGLLRAQLVLNASHTHSGPVTGQLGRPTYRLDAKEAAVVERYTKRLIEDVVAVIGEAIDNLEPAEMAFEQGYAGFAVNRRRVGHREYPGPVDHDVPTMTLRAPGGELKALVFGYSCHATVMNQFEIHGDYPAFAQAELEKRYPGAVALFLNGCGADQNPLPRRKMELTRMYGEILAEAASQVLAGKMAPVAGPLSAAYKEVEVDFQPAPARAELERRVREGNAAEKSNAQLLLEELESTGKLPNKYEYPTRVWRLGDNLTIVFLAGEVVVDYALQIRKKYGWDDVWVSGYNDDVFAYIPTERIIAEGGYEGTRRCWATAGPRPGSRRSRSGF